MAEPAARRSEIYRLIALGSDLDVAAHREVLERDGAVVQIVDRTRVLWTTIRDAGAWMGEPAPAYVLAMGTEERMRHSLDAAIWEVSCACRPEWERLNDELLELCEMGEGPSALALLHGPLACAVNVPSRLYGGTAVSCAAATGHAALVHRLLSLGASVTLRAPARGPLHCAWLPLACATVHAQHAQGGRQRELGRVSRGDGAGDVTTRIRLCAPACDRFRCHPAGRRLCRCSAAAGAAADGGGPNPLQAGAPLSAVAPLATGRATRGSMAPRSRAALRGGALPTLPRGREALQGVVRGHGRRGGSRQAGCPHLGSSTEPQSSDNAKRLSSCGELIISVRSV
eukprot:scaffold75295_cov65-Phaeocystis_antarctica.AAC.9